jgi:energy-converting hydrogenase A subunit M
MIFANDVRKVLKKKMPLCGLSDVMKAVSMDWVKLNRDKKREYFEEARRLKQQYTIEY